MLVSQTDTQINLATDLHTLSVHVAYETDLRKHTQDEQTKNACIAINSYNAPRMVRNANAMSVADGPHSSVSSSQ